MVSESIHALLTYSHRNLYQVLCQKEMCFDLFSKQTVWTWAEPDIQVCPRAGKVNTIPLTGAPPIPVGEARLSAQPGACGERREGSCSAQGSASPGWALSACHLPWCRVSEHSFSLSCLLLHPEAQVEDSTWGKPSKQNFMVVLRSISSVFPSKQKAKIRHLWVGAAKQCSHTSQPASY